MFVFRKIRPALFSWHTGFEILPFALLTTNSNVFWRIGQILLKNDDKLYLYTFSTNIFVCPLVSIATVSTGIIR